MPQQIQIRPVLYHLILPFLFLLTIDFSWHLAMPLEVLSLADLIILGKLLISSSFFDLLHQIISITILPFGLTTEMFLLSHYPPLPFLLYVLIYQIVLQVVTLGVCTDKLLLVVILITHQHVVIVFV